MPCSENGPYFINDDGEVEERKYAWDVTSNIIFVDSPVNVGYSYSDDPRDRVYNESVLAADLLDFLEEFLDGAAPSCNYVNTHEHTYAASGLVLDLRFAITFARTQPSRIVCSTAGAEESRLLRDRGVVWRPLHPGGRPPHLGHEQEQTAIRAHQAEGSRHWQRPVRPFFEA